MNSAIRRPPRSRWLLLAVFLLALTLSLSLAWRLERNRLEAERNRVLNLTDDHAHAIERQMAQALSAAYALAAMVRQGEGNFPEFEATARQLAPYYPGVSALQLAPGGVVQRSEPLAGNEKAIGHNLLKDPARTKEAFLARDSGKLTLAGPFPLIQGGLAAIGRLPVYLGDEAHKTFWGFVCVLIKFPDALASGHLIEFAEQGINYELWRIHPSDGKKQVIAASSSTPLSDPVSKSLSVPNATWILSAAPLRGWGDPVGWAIKSSLCLVFSLMLTSIAKLLIEGRQRSAALQATVNAIAITDRHGAIEWINPAFTALCGYSAAEAVGRNMMELQKSERHDADFYHEIQRTLAAGQVWRGEIVNRRKDGSLYYEDQTITPFRNPFGGVSNYIVIKQDVSARVEALREVALHRDRLEERVAARTADLERALAAAQLADQVKDAFLANISHELRTPLNAVIGLSELAARTCKEPKQRDYLNKIGKAGASLSRIINDLLDLSKIAAGRMEFESIAFGLRKTLMLATSVMAYKIEDKGLQLIEKIDDAVPDTVVGDPLRFEQILTNLLGNAIKFTQTGRIEIRVALAAREERRVCLIVEVEDSGIGMSAEEIAQLFQPFGQADSSMSRKYGGTGLGLTICKRLVEMMDGNIGVVSREGCGSTFRVELWLGLGQTEDIPADDNAADSAADSADNLAYRHAKVLVAEDQPLNREIVAELLAAIGVEPSIASTGKEALEILAAAGPNVFDLVLMDIQMPVMDGLSATRELRARAEFDKLPIVAMTAHTMEHERKRSLDAGMNDHIGKPFMTDNFYRVLAKWLPKDKRVTPAHAGAADESPAQQQLLAELAAVRGLDARTGLHRFADNEIRYRHWLNDFVASSKRFVHAIQDNLAAHRTSEAHKVVHAFKGRVGMLGMTELHTLATALDTAICAEAATDELRIELLAAIATMREELRQALNRDTA